MFHVKHYEKNMDLSGLRAEDFSVRNQREIYRQIAKTANRRLKQRRKENNVVYANRRVSEFLIKKGYKYFPRESVLDDKQLSTYLNELLLYYNDRTSLKSGLNAIKKERREKFLESNMYHDSLVNAAVTEEELDRVLSSPEWEELKARGINYLLILEDFSDEMERGRDVEELLRDYRELLNSRTATIEDLKRAHDSEARIEWR